MPQVIAGPAYALLQGWIIDKVVHEGSRRH